MTSSERRLVLLAVILLPAIGLGAVVLNPAGWPFWRAGRFTDLWISHVPNLDFIRYALITWHAIPLWNPLILSGMPLVADPLAGLWYPPHLLGWLGPGGLGFNLLFWGHLSWAAAGVLALLRLEGASVRAGLLGGLAFAATPKLIGHIGLGHLTLVEAMCWTPWVLVCVRLASDHALEGRVRWRYFATMGAVCGLTFLIDPRWLLPLGMLAAAYAGKCIAHSQERGARGRRFFSSSPLAIVAALAVAAPLALPLVQLVGQTTRALMTAEEAMSLRLPPAGLLGALVLQPGAWPETATYFGTTLLVLIVAALAAIPGRHRFWFGAMVVGLVLALGSPVEVAEWLSRIVPGLGLVRVPARFLMIAWLSAAMLGGHAFDTLLSLQPHAVASRRARLGALMAGGVVLALATVAAFVTAGMEDRSGRLIAWAPMLPAVLTMGTVIWIFRASSPVGLSVRAGGAILIALVALDLGWANIFVLETRSLPSTPGSATCVTQSVPLRFGDGRAFSPSYSLPQPVAAGCALELADGVNPLQLIAYRDFMAGATGIDVSGYSVTLPPFEGGDPSRDWSPTIDAELLGRLSVERIVASYPVQAPGLALSSQQAGRWEYVNLSARPRAWVELQGTPAGEWRPVDNFVWSPNRISLRARGPGRLVLSEVDYPGWHAQVDGQSAPIVRSDGLLRALDLPSGVHAVELVFRPMPAFLGAGLAATVLLLLVALWVRR